MSTASSAMTRIRNIGIIAHIDAGKTTLSERMLFYSSKIHRMGEVHDGAATMDYLPEEQERGITIMSACTTCHWREATINLVDTPGHVDFTIEVERALRVLDGAVGVFCAVGGVEPQSETVWRQSEAFGVPKVAFVNKMDRPGADFAAVLAAMRTRLGANAVAVAAPLGQGEDFRAVLDLVRQETLTFAPQDQGRSVQRLPFTPEEAALAAPWRDALLEKLAEADEAFLEPYLEGVYSQGDILAALRRATLARTLTPVLCGSALRNMGVQPVLDAVCDFLPSPLDVPAPVGRDAAGHERPVPPDPDAPAVALVFKVLLENGRKLAFLRLYAGQIKEGESLRNVNRGKEARLGRIYRPHAERREQIAAAFAGEIVAVVGLRSAHTGETYTGRGLCLSLESIEAYAPVLTRALEPRNADEGKILDEALARVPAARSHETGLLFTEIREELQQLSVRREQELAPLRQKQQRLLQNFKEGLDAVFAKVGREIEEVVNAPIPDYALIPDTAQDKYKTTEAKLERARIQIGYSRACIQIDSFLAGQGVSGLPKEQQTAAGSLNTVMVAVMGVSVKFRNDLRRMFCEAPGRERLQGEFTRYFELSEASTVLRAKIALSEIELKAMERAVMALENLETGA